MGIIKNWDSLNKTPERLTCLKLIETALRSIQPQNIIPQNISLKENVLTIKNEGFNLKNFDRVFLIGFGKGSACLAKEIEKILKNFLTKGYVIDLANESRSVGTKIEQTIGTHPLPSEENLNFTKKIIREFNRLTKNDLVFIVIAGGGSALLESPYKIGLEKLIEINRALLFSGATITEMNIVRKHLSLVKGGGLAKLLYPAKIISIIASDVPGNDLSVIASGPTVKDETTKTEALEILKKYNLLDKLNLSVSDFLETPKEDIYFNNTLNILLLSNQTALLAMQEKAQELGFKTKIFSNKFQGEAKVSGKTLIDNTPPHTILLVGGETTVKVVDKNGKGGRNQELVAGALPYLDSNTTIASFDSDGWDNSPFAGAIGDLETIKKAKELGLDLNEYLKTNNSFPFFEKTGDGIMTGRLPSNVSDLIIAIKSKNIVRHRPSYIEGMYGFAKTNKIISKRQMKKSIQEAVLEKFKRKGIIP